MLLEEHLSERNVNVKIPQFIAASNEHFKGGVVMLQGSGLKSVWQNLKVPEVARAKNLKASGYFSKLG